MAVLSPSSHVARPSGVPRGTVIVVHEIFGLTPHIRSLCDRLAAQGDLAIAPDLFSSTLHGAYLPYTAEGKSRGLGIKNGIGEEGMAASIVALARSDAIAGRVAVMGFCMGGTVAWIAANDPSIACAIGYYGVGLQRFLDLRPSCPVLMHFGLHDASIGAAEVLALRKRHPAVEVHEYDAGHAFNRDDDASYVADAAALAWGRTQALIQSVSRAEGPAASPRRPAGPSMQQVPEEAPRPGIEPMAGPAT